ncbi:MAG TPA: YeeE/YedE family protein [Burkholderiales bacterium]|nr:YeeE/YedE family protein [Burkholderiales bacterium]
MSEPNPAALASTVVWGAFALAFLFGAVANKTHFCTMGAVSDVVNMGDWNRMRMWLLAIAVATAGASALQLSGLIDLSKTIYTSPRFTWLSTILGGALFGIGMTLASGCGSKTLIRIGSGNLKSLVVAIVLAITAYMTLKGILAVFRVAALDPVGVTFARPQDLPSLLAPLLGAGKRSTLAILGTVISAGLLAFVFKAREFRTFDNILGGAVAGLVVVGCWFLSGDIGHLAEDPVTLEEKFIATNSGRMESFSFVAPYAYFLELLMLWSDKSRVVTLGIAAVLGMFSGSLAWSLATRTFRLESFRDSQDLINHLVGAVLMGFGGVLALGCTIGQGISGVSTLALGSFLAFFSIVAGAAATMKVQYWRLARQA